MGNHLRQLGMEQGFSPVKQVEVVDLAGRLLDYLPEQVNRHEAPLLRGQIPVGAEGAAEIAVAGGLHPEAGGKIGEGGPPAPKRGSDGPQALEMREGCRGQGMITPC
jgi:hypothetical protein